MVLLIIIILAIIAGIVVPRFLPTKRTEKWDEKKQETIVEEKAIAWMNWLVRGVCAVIALFCFFQTSFVIVGKTEVAHMDRVYWGSSMEPG